MNKSRPKSLIGTARKLLLFSMLFLVGFTAFASHFRYAQITFKQDGNSGHVDYTVYQAWRSGAFPNVMVGDPVFTGTSLVTTLNPGGYEIDLTVDSIVAGQDWFAGHFTVSEDYPSSFTNFTAFISGGDRIEYPLLNNTMAPFMQTSMGTIGNNDAPVAAPFPLIQMTRGTPYHLVATDPNSNLITYSLTPAGTFGTPSVQPPGISLSSTGDLNFLSSTAPGLYNADVTMTDGQGASVQVDFLIALNAPSTTNHPPFFVYGTNLTPANGSTITVNPGQTVNFTVKADDPDAGDAVLLTYNGEPASSIFTYTSANPAKPVQGNFSWATTAADAGSDYSIDYEGIDKFGLTVHTIVNIHVNGTTPPPTDLCAFGYRLLATDEIELGDHVNVMGNIGVTGAKGEFESDVNFTNPCPANAIRAKNVTQKTPFTDCVNPNKSPAVATWPTFILNTAPDTKNLPNLKITVGDSIYNGNFKNVEVEENLNNVTLTGTVFHDIKIEKHSKVTFTNISGVLNTNNIEVQDYGVILFSQNTNVLATGNVRVNGRGGKVNPTAKNVTFYLGDKKDDHREFDVKADSALIVANVYVKGPKGEIEMDGSVGHITNMYGTFIVMGEIEGHGGGNYVNWNPCTTTPFPYRHAALIADVAYDVIVAPNPSYSDFEFRVKSNAPNAPVSVRIVDVTGRIVAQKTEANALVPVRVGQNLATGSYFAEVTQGTERKVIHVVKLN